MHYLIIIIIIGAVLYFQIKTYLSTRKHLKNFAGIFPSSVEKEYIIDKNGLIEDQRDSLSKEIEKVDKKIHQYDGLSLDAEQQNKLSDLHKEKNSLKTKRSSLPPTIQNNSWNNILISINRYLKKNRGGVVDFHLIKDIVDRNCNAEEDTIQTQVPMPLYHGLIGTMAGIFVGVGYFWLSGGLEALLSTDSNAAKIATDGIVALLGGVALAMMGSMVGIGLATYGASKLKDSKKEVEERKHQFLSWLQSELLPKLNNDWVDVLSSVTNNLTDFNEKFSQNSREFERTLTIVQQATQGQADILKAINELKIKRVATANIEVYDKLKGCTDEIGKIYDQIKSSADYLDKVKGLSDKVDAALGDLQLVQDMAFFFKEERTRIENMQAKLDTAANDVATNLEKTLNALKSNSDKQIGALIQHTEQQQQKFKKIIDDQDQMIAQKSSEISRLVSNLGAVEKMIKSLDDSAKKQIKSIENLSQDIKDLAAQKTGGSVSVSREKLPVWAKTLIIFGGSVVTFYYLLDLVRWFIFILK